MLVAQSYLTLCDPMDCSLPSFSVHGILQARVLEWIVIPFSRGSSWPKDWNCNSCASCTTGRFFTAEPPNLCSKCLLRFQYLNDLWKGVTIIWSLQKQKLLKAVQAHNVFVCLAIIMLTNIFLVLTMCWHYLTYHLISFQQGQYEIGAISCSILQKGKRSQRRVAPTPPGLVWLQSSYS